MTILGVVISKIKQGGSMNDLQKPKRFIIECTEEQLEDLKEVIDYVINNEQDHFNEWLASIREFLDGRKE